MTAIVCAKCDRPITPAEDEGLFWQDAKGFEGCDSPEGGSHKPKYGPAYLKPGDPTPSRRAHEASVEQFSRYQQVGMTATLRGQEMEPMEALVEVITTGKPDVSYRVVMKPQGGADPFVLMVEAREGGHVAITHNPHR